VAANPMMAGAGCDLSNNQGLTMAKREKMPRTAEHVLFDVLYEDGTRSSNRKVPMSELGSLDGDTPAKPYIEAQDRRIAKISGKPRAPIKSISRSPIR
jgi:hypothetical protein